MSIHGKEAVECFKNAVTCLWEGFQCNREKVSGRELAYFGKVENDIAYLEKSVFSSVEDISDELEKEFLRLLNIAETFNLRIAIMYFRDSAKDFQDSIERISPEGIEFFKNRASNLLNQAENFLNNSQIEDGEAIIDYYIKESERYMSRLKTLVF